MKEKIKDLIKTYEKEVEFYKSIDEPIVARTYEWVMKDLEKLLGDEE